MKQRLAGGSRTHANVAHCHAIGAPQLVEQGFPMVRRTVRLVCAVFATCGLLMAPLAMAQDWGPLTQRALDGMTPDERDDALELLAACGSLYEQALDARRAESPPGSPIPDKALQNDTGYHYVATFGPGWDIQALENHLAVQNDVLSRGVESNGWVLTPGDVAAKRSTICVISKRIEQMERVRASSMAAAGIGPKTTERLAQMSPGDRRDNAEILQRCSQSLSAYDAAERSGGGYGNYPAGSAADGWAVQQLPLGLGATAAFMQQAIDRQQADIGTVLKHPVDIARARAWICMAEVRVGQLSGRSSTAAATAAPAAPSSAPAISQQQLQRLYREEDHQAQRQKLGQPTADALAELFRPGAPAATSPRLPTDYKATYDGEPATEQSRKDRAAAQQEFDKSKQRKLHNNQNDATSCIKVDRTGVRQEWGMEGHFRLTNTCSYPIAASWCSNTQECDAGRGNLWNIPPGKNWPVFSADPNFPDVRVGACKTGEAKLPLPPDADLARAGFDETHQQPIPAPGVTAMRNHRCE